MRSGQKGLRFSASSNPHSRDPHPFNPQSFHHDDLLIRINLLHRMPGGSSGGVLPVESLCTGVWVAQSGMIRIMQGSFI